MWVSWWTKRVSVGFYRISHVATNFIPPFPHSSHSFHQSLWWCDRRCGLASLPFIDLKYRGYIASQPVPGTILGDYIIYEGEGWFGFPDLWSGRKPRWNWTLTLVMNFGEVRRAQLVKSTLLASSLVPLVSFKVCSDAKAVCGKQREATAPTHP